MRLVLIEGIVIALGLGLLALLGFVASMLDPQLFPTALTTRS